MEEALRREISASVEAAMRSFEWAERALDAERLIAHFAAVPEFHVYNDGKRFSHEALTTTIRSGFSKIRSIDGGFRHIRVIVVSPEAALASAQFEEAVTDVEGRTSRFRGAASWLWRRIDERWRIVYGHVDHYPGPPHG